MSESITVRLVRIARARIESVVDQLEQNAGPEVMKESIREVDRLVDDVRREKEQATVRRMSAARSQKMLGERLDVLEKKARFALEEGREDLAEIAIGRQVDFETNIAELQTSIAAAKEDEQRLETVQAELESRREALKDILAAHEDAVTDAELVGCHKQSGSSASDRDRAMEKADSAFRRAMGSNTFALRTAADPEAHRGLGEIDAMARRTKLGERLTSLKASIAADRETPERADSKSRTGRFWF